MARRRAKHSKPSVKTKSAEPPIEEVVPLSAVPTSTLHVSEGTDIAYRKIAGWHLPNRVIDASKNKVLLSDFLTYLPVVCHWCKRSRKATQVVINGGLDLCCIDKKDCEKNRKKAAYEQYPDLKARKAKPKKKGAAAKTGAAESICGASHKASDGKKRKCRRDPDHKGKHKDKIGERW